MASITQLPSGSFRVQYSLNGKRKSKTFNSEREATYFVKQHSNALGFNKSLTVSDIMDKYLAQFNGRGGREALGFRLTRLAKYFDGLPLVNFTVMDLEQYKELRSQSVQPTTVRLELQLLSRLLKYARRSMLLEVPDVFKDFDYPRANKPRERIVTPEELDMLLGDVTPLMSDIFSLCYETAMRRSEVVYLLAGDVDLNNRQLFIREAKNGHSRYVPLNQKAISLLARLLEGRQKQERLFDVEPHSVSKAFTRSCKRLGIEGLCLHGLRHSAITKYARKGLSTAQLQVVSGHRDITMLQRYTHLQASDVADLLD